MKGLAYVHRSQISVSSTSDQENNVTATKGKCFTNVVLLHICLINGISHTPLLSARLAKMTRFIFSPEIMHKLCMIEEQDLHLTTSMPT